MTQKHTFTRIHQKNICVNLRNLRHLRSKNKIYDNFHNHYLYYYCHSTA
jgi:DNA-binding LytR/AlgR family response regulator